MYVSGSFPPGRDSPVTADVFCRYINFMTHIGYHGHVVFADEKPMKELMLFRKRQEMLLMGAHHGIGTMLIQKIVTTYYVLSLLKVMIYNQWSM